jgi:hypothetical protein
MNTFAYLLYLGLTYFITVHVGLLFYRNGRLYILQLLHGDGPLTDFINRVLLTGYYLLNLGYAALMIRSWQTVHTPEQVFTTVLSATGKIVLTLGVIHFFNMSAIYLFSKNKFSIHQHKN